MVQVPSARSLELRSAVQTAYSLAAERPAEKHAFPVGRILAERLGYSTDLLDTLPLASVEAFAGVSNLAVAAAIPAGAIVLDLGCGAGLDSLIAARRVGATGHVFGIDFSGSMLARARQAATAYGTGVTFCRGDAEQLPLAEASVDMALVNGIFNLNPARIGSLIGLTDAQFNSETAPNQWTYRVVAKHVLTLEQDSLKTIAADQAAQNEH